MQQLATQQGSPDGSDSPQDLALRGELGQALGSSFEQLPPADLTGDALPEYIGFITLPGAPISGMTAAKQMAVAGLVRRKPKVILHLSAQGILGSKGKPLLPQIASSHGYGFRLQGTAESPAIVVVLLDANGQPASDELSLVWDAQTNQFQPQQ